MAAELPRQAPHREGRILVSACLLGQPVRYDGGHQRFHHPLVANWEAEGRLIPCCPEVLGGLPTPRPPVEILGGDGTDVLRGTATVRTAAGKGVTHAFVDGARAALKMVHIHRIRLALLCQRSPSCGSRWVYNGRFEGVLEPGMGVTAALLTENGVAVFAPDAVTSLAACIEST